MSIVGRNIAIQSDVQAYPPIPLQDYGMYVENQSSKNGWYQVTGSSETAPAWRSFNQDPSSGWASASNYNSASPFLYAGSEKTVDVVTKTVYAGEWLQIRLAHAIVPMSLEVTCGAESTPSALSLLGSKDGLEWYHVDSRTALQWAPLETKTFSMTTSNAYMHYRLVSAQINDSTGVVRIAECKLYGRPVTVVSNGPNVGINTTVPNAALEIGGDVTIHGQLSAPISTYRNRAMNGAMVVANRGGSNVTDAGTSFNGFVLDRFGAYKDANDGVTVTYSQQAVTDLPSFSHALRAVVSGASASPALRFIGTGIEGGFLRDCQIGRAQCTPMTLSFWVKSSVTGTNYVRVRHTNNDSSTFLSNIVIPYTVHNASVWEKKTIIIPPIVLNPLEMFPTCWLQLAWTLCPGSSNWNAGAAINTWQTSNPTLFYHGTGQANLVATTGNQFWLTGVQLEKGTIATPFEHRPYHVEDYLCRRYYESGVYNTGRVWATVGTFGHGFTVPFTTYKRVIPPAIGLTFTSIINASGGINDIHQNNFVVRLHATTGDNASGRFAWTADVDKFY